MRFLHTNGLFRFWALGLVCTLIILAITTCRLKTRTRLLPLWAQTLDFDRLQFRNETGNPSGCYVVPNYIHFIHFGGTPLRYWQMICVLAAFKNQKPDKIFFHYDNSTTFAGKYWDVLLQTPGFIRVMIQHKIQRPTEIDGQPLNGNFKKWNASDIARIQTLMEYGGIYLDIDCYLIKSIDEFRGFEISVSWGEGVFIDSQVIMAHKDARFLKKWLECYKYYDETKWHFVGERPTVEVLYKQPELVHRVKELFGTRVEFIKKIFEEQWPGWRKFYILHLAVGHLNKHEKIINKKAGFPVEFNETNIAYYPVTFREMAYDVYDVANITWPKDKFS